jgi:hypothetical protein
MFCSCYHLVNGISYSVAQSKPIKWRPLFVNVLFTESTFVKFMLGLFINMHSEGGGGGGNIKKIVT